MTTITFPATKLTPEQTRKLQLVAKARKTDVESLLANRFQEWVNTMCLGDELSPAEAGLLLGVSRYTVIRWVHAKAFPNAVVHNERNIKIPRADVEQLLRDRKVA